MPQIDIKQNNIYKYRIRQRNVTYEQQYKKKWHTTTDTNTVGAYTTFKFIIVTTHYNNSINISILLLQTIKNNNNVNNSTPTTKK